MNTPFQNMHDENMSFVEKEVTGGTEIIKIPAVKEWTLKDLKYTCKRNKVKGYTKMSRDELVAAVENIIAGMKGVK